MEIAKILVSQTTGRCIIKKHIPAGLVGGTVSVKYDDPIWDRLVKTVVFRGTTVKAADKFDGKTAVIPWECLEHPGPYLFFGIWGSDPDSALQLPLIEVRIGPIEDATDPTADPGTDPTLPIWAQLKEEIERLKQDGVSEEKIAQIVEDYLAKNPPKVTEEDPTVPEWAKQPEKPEYTAEEVGAIPKDNLQGAINTALAQAKESGEFDGPPGPAGDDYVLTDADKAEIAEMAAGMVEVPDSGGNVDQEQIEQAVSDYLTANPVSGLTDTEKKLIISLFENIEYTQDMSGTVNRLRNVFAGLPEMSYAITNNLENVTNSSDIVSIVEGSAYSATLTAADGCYIDSVTITMGGVDVTASVYADGVINIASVNGDIVITATGISGDDLAPVYRLAEPTTFDKTNVIDSGYDLLDEEKDWTIIIDFTPASKGTNMTVMAVAGFKSCGISISNRGSWFWSAYVGLAAGASYVDVSTTTGESIKVVFSHASNSNAVIVYYVDGTSRASRNIDVPEWSDNIANKTEAMGKGRLFVGGDNGNTLDFDGKIDTLMVYERVLDENEINEFLGV